MRTMQSARINMFMLIFAHKFQYTVIILAFRDMKNALTIPKFLKFIAKPLGEDSVFGACGR